MKTSQSITCITWSTKEFLIESLNKAINQNWITYYCFIYHHAEADEKKDHIHLFITPAKQIETDQLRERFLTEMDPTNGKPIRPAQFRKCGFNNYGDWYLYVKHDVNFLLSKFQKREYHYADSDFIMSSEEEFLELKHSINFSKYNGNKIDTIVRAISEGVSFTELVASGVVPIQQMNQYERAYELMQGKAKVWRDGKLSDH